MKKATYPRSRRTIKMQTVMSNKAATIIANNYNELKESLCSGLDICCAGETQEDVFSDTVVLVIHERNIEEKNEEQLIKHFKRRFNMLLFRTLQEDNSIKKHLNRNKHGLHTQKEEEL